MIGVIGINYKSSPIEIREKFSFNEKRIVEFGNIVRNNDGFKGLVILSTCNRSEIYFQMEGTCNSGAYSFMLKSLKSYCGVTENVREYFYFKSDTDAFKHLFYVISGANSMIIGEDQIVGQVKQALKISTENAIVDSELTRLFIKSLEVNKKVRTATKINQGAFSVSYAGVEKCFTVFNDISKCKILLIGAGETGTLTLKTLIKKGCENITITNRTQEKADKLAQKYRVQSIDINLLKNQLDHSDIIVIATGAQEPLITESIAQQSITNREGKKQLYIDLSVPRNVAREVSLVDNVTVFDVDDLQEVVDANQEKRKNLIKQMDSIMEEHLQDYSDWLATRNLGSLISAIKTNFSSVNQSELQGFKRINKANDVELIDNYGTHITEKYTRLLIKNLKEVTNNGRKMEYVKVLNDLFNLN